MGKVNVIIADATENKERKVELPDDIKSGIIMEKVVEKIKLPSTGPDGNPISYKFVHKVSGRQLLETQTLADAHIKDGDVLRLQPEITAAAICPNCGKELQDGAAFCTNCGRSMSAPQYNYSQPQYSYSQPQYYDQPQRNPFGTFLDNKAELVKIAGFVGAGLYVVSGVASSFFSTILNYSNFFLRVMYALSDVGMGLFMAAVVLYMLHKMEK